MKEFRCCRWNPSGQDCSRVEKGHQRWLQVQRGSYLLEKVAALWLLKFCGGLGKLF